MKMQYFDQGCTILQGGYYQDKIMILWDGSI